ncbi:MAG TPA: thioredoxin domain-containing protein [Candidatus Limnocylindrales bacterium]|nr:thioredoxin domain-containing protein [Candidatus Limnocylindrales bacterium]
MPSEPAAPHARENRLAREKSPYLLQHAKNPVDWYPWGNEAFEKARAEDRPIFLSIGYATCHWCHVMERESFESAEIAQILNSRYVPIKVDREERPDLDHVYMTVCQALTGSGGWPLTVILTPDARPFLAGTYFPPETRFGRPGLKEVLYQVLSAWEGQRERVESVAGQIVEAVRGEFAGTPGERPDVSLLTRGFEHLQQRFDEEYGGFGTAPKFPTPHQLTFLLRYWKRTGDGRALDLVERTLRWIRRGGIYDQIGFGAHRYSTDREWLVPHFEKMLYDRPLLMMAYAEAHQATGDALYASVAREIATCVARDLTSPEGAFYSAEDADSEGEEGKFYVWSLAEIREALGAEEAALFAHAYGAEEKGNWIDPAAGGHLTGTNILHLTEDPLALARETGLLPAELARRLEADRVKLLEIRSRRVRPLRDDKVLTAWNGLMIAALAKASVALEDPGLAEAAVRAAAFLETHLLRADGRLLARWREGEAAHPAYLDDYAFLAWGSIELYEATFDPRHLERALALVVDMERLFWDETDGGFFFTGSDAEPLLARTKEIYDGAIPSGNSVAVLVLLRLARMTGRSELERRAEETVLAFGGSVARLPGAHTQLLSALDFAFGPTHEVVVAGAAGAPETRALLRAARGRFAPRAVFLLTEPGAAGEELAKLAPFTAAQGPVGGRPAAYVCENFACSAPITDPSALASTLEKT